MAREFLIGGTLAGGAYVIDRRLRGPRGRGIYRGTRAGGPGSVLITVAPRQKKPHRELWTQLDATAAGLSRLRHIGAVEPPRATGGDVYEALVEDEPAGVPSTKLMPLTAGQAVALALAVAKCAGAVHAQGKAMGGIRPELIFARRDVDRGVELTAMAPRAEMFVMTAEQPAHGVLPLFQDLYQAPEVLAREPATPASDVFSLCATLAYWASGEYPFTGDELVHRMVSVSAGMRRPWTGPEGLAPIVARGLAPAADRRLALPELIAQLASLDASGL